MRETVVLRIGFDSRAKIKLELARIWSNGRGYPRSTAVNRTKN